LDFLRNVCRNSFGHYLIDAYKTNCKGKKIWTYKRIYKGLRKWWD
jgi:hypothetical protein